jgi:hypothetical protein
MPITMTTINRLKLSGFVEGIIESIMGPPADRRSTKVMVDKRLGAW